MEVKLLTITKDPVESLYALWYNSRNKDFMSVDKVKSNMLIDPKFYDEVMNTVKLIYSSSIPVGEAIQVTFWLKDVPVALREQLVRHRTTSPWVQTSRTVDNRNFEGYVPENIRNNKEALSILEDAYEDIRVAYSKLVDLGIPVEDARVVNPEGRLHSLAWTANLRNLIQALRQRSCWIAQSSLWAPVLIGMKRELSTVSPLLASLLTVPPCNYKECKYPVENERRVSGEDPLPVCPLFITNTKHLDKYPTNQDMYYYEKCMTRYKELWSK